MSPIRPVDVKASDAGDILTGRFPLARQPDLALDKIAVGQGSGSDPVAEDKPSPRIIVTGTYTGNDADNRQITTGSKCSMVIVLSNGTQDEIVVFIPNRVTMVADSGCAIRGTLSLHASDGFVVHGSTDPNASGIVYYYWAISE